MEVTKKKYDQDPFARFRKIEYMANKYNTDVLFQKKRKEYLIRRYHTDALYQRKKKYYMVRRYKTDDLFRKKMKDYMVRRYKTDNLFQKKMKDYMVRRYKMDDLFQKKMKDYMARRYAIPEERRQEWICHTCDSHLKRGSMPSIAVANKLDLPPIPAELLQLNVLERQLIARIVPFAKIVALPKGQQRAVHGAVVCVPSEVEQTVNCLPRPSSESQLLQVKLKRHIKFRGYQHFHTVNMHSVLAALAKLKAMHSEYKDILISDAATFEFLPDDDLDDTEEKQEVGVSEQDDQNVSTEEKDELRPGLTLDTCMQPLDIGQDLLSFGEGIFSIAPAQGKKPVGFFRIPKLEAMAFPVQFCTGQNTIDEAREVALSPSMYFNARLFCVDSRFAKDQSYLFFAQFVTETHMARNSMSIQLRKGKPVTRDGRRISNKLLQDDLEVERLVHSRDATRFMQPLRGTPSYWEKTLRDLQAMIRQLGTPTFFCTFSAAEMRWPEVITAIKAQQGEEVDFSELDWTTKCEILRSNPVTVMRMFEKRVDALMTHLLLSPAQPIGEVEDYFYRVEFQARGSPHIHLLAWVKGAPEFENQSDQEVCDFIDRYITCHLPDSTTDPELHKIVTEVQLHSRKHSKSCKKGNVLCRYGFPKLPVTKTTITRPRPQRPEEDENEDQNRPDGKKARQEAVRKAMNDARMKLKPLWDLLNDPQASFDNLSDLLTKCDLSMDDYNNYVEALSTSSVILLKRDPKEAWVNGYNPDLLRAWNANMDIQFVLDSYSCIMYMLSYISKPEHEMNDFLKNVIKGVRETNINEEDEMKNIMQAYSKHRQVSAQESVARTCSLPMKKCSRNVVFIPTDDDALKMSLPLSALHNKDPDSEDVWMSGMIDKYRARPRTLEFEMMCLADFVSNYRVVYGRQTKGKNVHQLLNGMGFIQKRTVEIMRQKEDLAFAELLNRLRVKQKTEALREDDRALLLQAVKKPEDCPRDALHIFATNKEVQKYNTETVQALYTDIITIDAEDYRKDPKTGGMKRLNKPVTGKKNDLLDSIEVAVGVRVMITRNLDVEDGIVNGCFGKIGNIVTKTKDGIAAETSQEAYACTAHKVQGMTMQSAVVSLKKIFEPGMAYVALSRTTSLNGLHITDFDDKKIYADPEITASLHTMRRAPVEEIMPLLQHVRENRQENTLTIVHHNTEGLGPHIEDIRCHHELQLADILCLTETHLTGSSTSSDLKLEGYNLITRNRHVSYSTHQEIGTKNGGGVAIYCKEHIPTQPRQYIQNVTDLEFVVIKIDSPIKAAIVAVYRPPQYNVGDFLTNLKSMLDYLDLGHNDLVIICGDFNEDLLHTGKKPILELFQSRGYTQLITAATTEKHTLLDHIYISNPDLCLQSGVLQSYHSYHNPVYCVLRFA
ncbi:replicase helicase endonuclease [Labeo rohita]|uniref:Replicase helicase endonuclease n=1 Tax=Labeo rohita TaxID=84645 RepID=A0A498NXF8_LABRO|nr:replicase helicase endonuclease [Labeo rohita]